MEIITGLFGGAGTWIVALVGGLVAVAGAYLKGRSAGAAKAEAKQNAAIIERIDEDKRHDNEIAGLSPDERARRGERWVREPPGP